MSKMNPEKKSSELALGEVNLSCGNNQVTMALKALDEGSRDVLLRNLRGQSFQQISEELGTQVTPAQAEEACNSALRALRKDYRRTLVS